MAGFIDTDEREMTGRFHLAVDFVVARGDVGVADGVGGICWNIAQGVGESFTAPFVAVEVG